MSPRLPSRPLPATMPTPHKAPPPKTVDSQALLGGGTVLLIQHQGETYRLQTTRQGKLILTK